MRAMMSEGPDAYVSTAMDRNFPRVSPDAELSEVMPRLSSPVAEEMRTARRIILNSLMRWQSPFDPRARPGRAQAYISVRMSLALNAIIRV